MEFEDGQPTVNGMFVRSVDALTGSITDLDDSSDGRHRVKVEFPHERVDTYRTVFAPDCFTESFAEFKPPMVWQHDLRDLIGRAEKAQSLRQHNELIGRFSDTNAVPRAAQAYSQIRDGDLTDFSFGFRDPLYTPHETRGVRRISKAKMKEFSPVTIGSIPDAKATGIREDDVMAELGVEQILKLRNEGLISDEDAQQAIKNLHGMEHITIGRVRKPGEEPPAPVRIKGTMVDGEFVADEVQDVGAEGDGDAGRSDDELPERIGPAEILEALPEAFQRALAENDARLFLVLGDEEWGPLSERSEGLDESALELIEQMDQACRHGAEWLNGVDKDAWSDELRQAFDLFAAAGDGAAALMVATGQRADGDAEDMDSHVVKCSLCEGVGRVDTNAKGEGGKMCPKCEGSGVEAVQRDAYWQDPLFLRFVSVDERKKYADSGIAMPNGDFPIPDKGHLQSALGHFSKYTGDKKAAAAHIKKRAKALGVDLSDDALGDDGDDGDDGSSRADMPDGAKECPRCDGDGKLPAPPNGGPRLTCPKCKGKGWVDADDNTRAKPDDDDDSQDDMVDEAGSGKPSGEGAAANEDDDDGDSDAGDKDSGATPMSADDDEDDDEAEARAIAMLDRHGIKV
jgi:HK97 family phage prohead protease